MSVNSQVARNQSRQTFDSVFESVGRQGSIFPLGSHYEGGQRMVEYFTGHSLNTDRWIITGNGSAPYNTSGMINAVDGGYEIMPTPGNNVSLTMNDIRQFNHVDSGFVAVVSGKSLSSSRTESNFGFSGAEEFSGVPTGAQSKAVFEQDALYNYLSGCTSQGSGETMTALVPNVTMYNSGLHVCKCVTTVTSCDFSRNGILGVVITTNLPDSKMQPAYEVRSIGGSTGNSAGSITYFEAWNK